MRKSPELELDASNVQLTLEPEDDDNNLFGQFVPYRPEGMASLLGPFKSRDLFLPNFSLRTFEGVIPRDAMFYDPEGKGNDMAGSCIFFKGGIETRLAGTQQGIQAFNGSQNFKFDPHNELRHYCKADTELNFIHISMKPDFLHEILPENETWAGRILEKVERKERFMGNRFAAVSRAQEQALSNLFHNPLSGKLGYMMMETSIMQVILLQMHALFQADEAQPATPCIQKRDLEIIYEVRDYLAKTFLENHTLCGLAREFGTNTNKLMTLFRRVFSQSIFEYIAEQRMVYAQQLLKEGGLLIAEVSRSVGYKNPNHFSAAFKKRFGVRPSILVREA